MLLKTASAALIFFAERTGSNLYECNAINGRKSCAWASSSAMYQSARLDLRVLRVRFMQYGLHAPQHRVIARLFCTEGACR